MGVLPGKMLCDSLLPGSSGVDWMDEVVQTYCQIGTNTLARDGRDRLRWCISGGTVLTASSSVVLLSLLSAFC